MSADLPNPTPSGSPPDRMTASAAEVIAEAAKTIPISAEAAAGQIEAVLRLHQRRPGRDIFIMIAGIALAAAASVECGSPRLAQP